jgi:PhnB protein
MAEEKTASQGYHTFQAHLIARNCASAIDFYKRAFGATERMRAPSPDGRVGHAELQLGDTVIMMADEHPEMSAYSPEHYGGSPVSFYVYVDDCDAAYKQAIAAGGKSEREPTDMPYGDRVAGIIDPFGYRWYVAHHISAAQA